MTDVLGTLMHKGLLSLEPVAQDGTRVRAHASAAVTNTSTGSACDRLCTVTEW